VDILVYRGGTLARLGHNHVMTSKAVTGRVWVHSQLAKSGFELAFPVAELIVDDAQARRAAGAEFPPEIPQADKEGTRKNMLRTEVLDAEHFPQVSLQSVRISVGWGIVGGAPGQARWPLSGDARPANALSVSGPPAAG
jgi:hypothetical protein